MIKEFKLFILLVCILFVGCKKDKRSQPEPVKDKTYAVVFNTGEIEPISNKQAQPSGNRLKAFAGPVSDASATVLYYIVTENTPYFPVIKIISQDSTSQNFGHIVDHLPAGEYMVNLIAGQAGLALPADMGVIGYPRKAGSSSPYWSDTFVTRFPLEITNADITKTVSLDRLVAQLQVKILDALPLTAKTFRITIDNEYRYYVYSYETYLASTTIKPIYDNNIPISALGEKDYKFSFMVFNTFNPINIKLECYDANNAIIAEKSINNISLEKNRRTILSGNMFGTSNETNVVTNHEWDPIPHTTVNF